nr:MAG TPA: hypothetical protein [Bacteriophage sp.]
MQFIEYQRFLDFLFAHILKMVLIDVYGKDK